jgi:DNA-binding MarR family transcriptional regulator
MEKKLQNQKAVTFTPVYHEALETLELNVTEYMIADTIAQLSKPGNSADGWCYMSKESMAKVFHITPRQVFRIINTLIKKQLVEKHPETGFLKAAPRWIDEAIQPYRL